jgi:hypothetical protein
MKNWKIFLAGAALFLAACVTAGIDFGNNSSEYANDGECDDPRFAGGGMASSLDARNIRRDASDCSQLLAAQRIRPARTRDQWQVSMCASVDFGNNSSQWARDRECDDPRFTGPGVDDILVPADLKADAADCRALCNAGQVWLK